MNTAGDRGVGMSLAQLDALLNENAALLARAEEGEATLAAIRNGDVDAIVVGNDIYTLDSANAASNRLRKDVLAQMQDAVLAFDNEHHLIYMNPAAERQYGKASSEMLGREQAALYDEVWPDPAGPHRRAAELASTGASRSRTLHRIHAGATIDAESTVSSLLDAQGATLGYLCVIRDISARVAAEQTLLAATAALARREREFSTLVQNSPDIFARMDRDLRHVYVSPIIEKYTGIDAAQYTGKTHAELGMPAELCAAWAAALNGVFESGTIGAIRFAFSSIADGERIFQARLIPEFADDATVESVLSIASDVTDQDAIDAAFRESQARLRFTLESAKIGEFELDVASDTARTSLRHDRCFGYAEPVQRWGRQIMLAHVHPDDRAGVEAAFVDSDTSHRDVHFECRVIWPDASIHWIEAHANFYEMAGRGTRLLGIVADTTDRKRAEEALRDAGRRKDEFLATLAHELRNPLAPIRNAMQIMRVRPDVAEQINARAIVERQLAHMVHLVDDLLDVSRISQGKLDLRLERVDVAEAVETAIETSRPLIDAGRHALKLSLPERGTLIVDADPTRLCQVISNLLNNAAKYTPPRGSIELCAERRGADVMISVRDSGVGIAREMLPRIFDMFAQVDRSMEQTQGGLGIGLALVKRLVDMHGGRVEAGSEGPERGSTFTVHIPLASLAARPAANETLAGATTAQVHGRRVLIVDDNVDSAESLSEVLQLSGFETQVVHDGVAAVEQAEAFEPSAVLLDIGLPKLNGHEAAKRIRSHAWGRDLMLIALSGWGQPDDRRKSKAAGFDHHFVKPVDLEMLTTLLARDVQEVRR